MRVGVVGGGLGGLLTAAELRRRGAEPVVFEATNRVGGVAATIPADGFLFETGAGSFPLPHPVLSPLVREAGIPTEARQGSSRRYVSDGGPFVPLGPSPLGLVRAAGRLGGVGGIGSALAEPLRQPAPVDGESLSAFLGRRLGPLGRVGAELVATGVYAGDPDRLEAAAVVPGLVTGEAEFGSLLRAARRSRRAGVPRPVQHLVEGGMQAFADGLAAYVGEVHTGRPVEAVGPVAGGWSIDGHRVDHAVLAVGPEVAASMLGRRPPDPWPSAPVAVIGLGGAEDRMPVPEGFGGLVLGKAGMSTLGVLFERAPEATRLCKVLAGGARRPGFVDRPDEEVADVVLDELSTLVGGTVAPDWVEVARRRIPQHEPGHLARVADFEARLPDGVSVAGWWYRGIGVGSLALDAGRLADHLVG